MEIDIDPDIGTWILEFLFRQPLEDKLVNSLISILPLTTSNNPRLKKSLLLRKLESEVSKGPISETLLDLLEQIEQVDLQAGITEHSESIKAAYLAVAVECTIKFLSNNGREDKYFDAVKRIWKGRVCKLGKAEGAGLISEVLLSWKDDIEAVVWEDSAHDTLLKRCEGVDAIEAVRVYVKEEKGKMGPSFLESLAEAFRVDEQLRILLENRDQARDKEMNLPGDNQNAGPSHEHENREVHKDNVHSKPKQIASKRSKAALAGTNRGAKIADVDTSDGDEPNKKCDLPATLEVNGAVEALESSPFKPQASVEDPPPDSFLIAEKAASDMTRKNISNESMEEGNTRADPPVARGSQATQDNLDNMPDHSNRPHSNGSKTSLIAQNVTDPTFEDFLATVPEHEEHTTESPMNVYTASQKTAMVGAEGTLDELVLNPAPITAIPQGVVENEEDSKDDILLDSQDEGGSRLHLRSQKRKLVSPPKVYEHHKVSKRRKPRRWSLLEEDTLRTGVETFGRGNWKLILGAYRDIFEERTEVDLKDKWRNLNR